MEEEFEWGYKARSMKDDDTIFEMGYQDGTKKNSIKILLSDFRRLEPSIYLNDTLILFFLKFLQNFVIPEKTRMQTHKKHRVTLLESGNSTHSMASQPTQQNPTYDW